MTQACRATRFIFLAFGMGFASWAPMIPFVKSRLGLDEAQFGLLLLLSGIGGVFMLGLSSWLIKHFGSRLVIVVSGILMLILLPLLTIAPTLPYFSITFFLFGCVCSAMNIAMNAQAVTVESESKRSLMSSFHCLCSMGNWLGVLIIGLLLEIQCNLFYCAGVISIFIAIIIASQLKNLLPDEVTTNPSQISRGIVEPRVFLLGFLCFVAFISEGCVLNWSAEFLRSSLHYSTAQAGIGYVFFAIAMTVGRLLGDRIISRFGQLITFQVSCLLEAAGFAVWITPLWPYTELVGFLLAGFGASNMIPILISSTGKFRKTAPHYALAIITSCGSAGALIGSVFVGFVANAFSLTLAFGCISAMLFIAGLFGSSVALKPSKTTIN
jgi:predicted MFS family arabinose efflux permease